MTKSDQIYTFFKKSGPEMSKYDIFGARTRKNKKKRPCEERTTTEPVVGRNPIHGEFEGWRPLINCRVREGSGERAGALSPDILLILY